MYTLSVTNSYKETLTLTGNPMFDVVDIDGLDPPDVILNTYNDIGADGSVLNSAYLDNRQIIITIAINRGCETVRNTLYQFFQQKKQLTLRFSNEFRNVKTSCYVKNFNIAIFSKKQTVQITLLCPKPSFDDVWPTRYAVPMMDGTMSFPIEFPDDMMEFSNTYVATRVTNRGDSETGFTASMRFFAETKNPVITNVTNGEHIGFGMTLSAGDTIQLCTVNNNKYAKKITSGGVTSSIAAKIMAGSEWLQLVPGENVLSLDSDDDVNFDAEIEITAQYMGV